LENVLDLKDVPEEITDRRRIDGHVHEPIQGNTNAQRATSCMGHGQSAQCLVVLDGAGWCWVVLGCAVCVTHMSSMHGPPFPSLAQKGHSYCVHSVVNGGGSIYISSRLSLFVFVDEGLVAVVFLVHNRSIR
jgi:hypothetical protein